jgi:hypothetical protein
MHKIALEACISDLAPDRSGAGGVSNSFEDFLLEFTKKFGTTVLTKNTPFRVRGEVCDRRMTERGLRRLC